MIRHGVWKLTLMVVHSEQGNEKTGARFKLLPFLSDCESLEYR